MAQGLSQSAIAIELAAALDLWALVRRSSDKNEELTKKLERLARRLDSDDPWRNDLRDLIPHGKDKQAELEELAKKAEFRELPKLSIVLLGEALWSVGSWNAAIDVFRRGRLVHPQDFGLCFRLALMREMSGRWATEVVSEYSTAAALRPSMNEAWHRLGCTMGCAGRHREAEGLFRMLAERDPDNPHWLQHVGDSLKDQGKPAEAIPIYQKILARHPKLGGVHLSLGVSFSRQGDLDEALECFRTAVALKAKPAVSHRNIGIVLERQGKPEQAVESYRQALKIAPKLFNARRNLKVLLVSLGRRDEAIESHLEWRELEPQRPIIHSELGMMLRSEGRLKEALRSYRRARDVVSRRDEGVDQQWRSNWMRSMNIQISSLERALRGRPRLLAIARGQVHSTSARTLINAADAAYDEKEYLASARTYAKAFEASTGGIRTNYGNCYNAVCSQVLAAGGHGKDAKGLTAAEREKLRERAYEYLYAQVAREVSRIKKRSDLVTRAARRLAFWFRDKDLLDVRDEEKLKTLPPEEAERWRKLWRKARATLSRAKKVAEATQWLQACRATYKMGDYVSAARGYTKALAEHPEMLPIWSHRFYLACSLAMAAAGKGKGAQKLSAAQRNEMRADAYTQLAAEFALLKLRLERREKVPEMIRRLKVFLGDGDFEGVRGEALKTLPAEQAESWRTLWKDVRATLKRFEKKE